MTYQGFQDERAKLEESFKESLLMDQRRHDELCMLKAASIVLLRDGSDISWRGVAERAHDLLIEIRTKLNEEKR